MTFRLVVRACLEGESLFFCEHCFVALICIALHYIVLHCILLILWQLSLSDSYMCLNDCFSFHYKLIQSKKIPDINKLA